MIAGLQDFYRRVSIYFINFYSYFKNFPYCRLNLKIENDIILNTNIRSYIIF